MTGSFKSVFGGPYTPRVVGKEKARNHAFLRDFISRHEDRPEVVDVVASLLFHNDLADNRLEFLMGVKDGRIRELEEEVEALRKLVDPPASVGR